MDPTEIDWNLFRGGLFAVDLPAEGQSLRGAVKSIALVQGSRVRLEIDPEWMERASYPPRADGWTDFISVLYKINVPQFDISNDGDGRIKLRRADGKTVILYPRGQAPFRRSKAEGLS